MKIKEVTIDISTGEETLIERVETDAEIVKREAFAAEAEKLATLHAEAEAARVSAAAKLSALGLTIDDLKALGL